MEAYQTGVALPLPWQEGVWKDFSQALEYERLPHALLISGPNGIGKQRLATALAHRLLCTAEMNNYACGACKGCQLLAAGSHPDLALLEPPDAGKDILIGDIRKLISTLDKTAQQGGWKVAIIAPSESMNNSSSNALLKSLEEPQGKTLIILVSHRPSLLSATIRSRCQKKALLTPPAEAAGDWLKTVTGDNVSVGKALEVASGRPLLALECIQSDSLKEQETFERMLVAVRDGKLSFIDAAQQCSKLAPPQALEWFMNYIHRLVTSDSTSQGNQKIYLFSDRLHLMHAMILSGSNVNQQLLWEELLMSWTQVFSNR